MGHATRMYHTVFRSYVASTSIINLCSGMQPQPSLHPCPLTKKYSPPSAGFVTKPNVGCSVPFLQKMGSPMCQRGGVALKQQMDEAMTTDYNLIILFKQNMDPYHCGNTQLKAGLVQECLNMNYYNNIQVFNSNLHQQ